MNHLVFVGTFIGALVLELGYVELFKPLHTTPLNEAPKAMKRFGLVVLALLIVFSCYAMSVNPIWNGEYPAHRNQYELLADAFLEGRLDLDYGDIGEQLMALDNPYDPEQREAAGIDYPWDHAFYKGHFYMYFGVVPVLLLFVPFKVLTGMSLTTYHATQVFVTGFYGALFLLSRLLARRYYPRMSFGAWLLLTVTVSFCSVWNCVSCPALYNTAVSSAVCLMTWSVYFYVKAVLDTDEPFKALRLAFVGAVFGALAFGCRPPIALGNLVAIPLLVVFLKKHRLNWRLWIRLGRTLLPYEAVALGLMLYNQARFENPFEFGQAYQMTLADQSHYGSRSLLDFHWTTLANGLIFNFFRSPELRMEFPFFGQGGVFLVFPVFAYCIIAATDGFTRRRLREQKLSGLAITLSLCPVAITLLELVWAPFLIFSYQQDWLWLLAILTLLLAGLRSEGVANRAASSRWVCRWCVWTLAVCFMIFADYLLQTE